VGGNEKANRRQGAQGTDVAGSDPLFATEGKNLWGGFFHPEGQPKSQKKKLKSAGKELRISCETEHKKVELRQRESLSGERGKAGG